MTEFKVTSIVRCESDLCGECQYLSRTSYSTYRCELFGASSGYGFYCYRFPQCREAEAGGKPEDDEEVKGDE
jgi:hypothetical protein